MQGSALSDTEEWAMPERRERAVMRDMPTEQQAKPGNDDFRMPNTRNVLSKDEIEALLRPNLPKINEQEAPADVPSEPFTRELESGPAQSAEGKRLAARLTLLFAQATGLKASFRYSSSKRFERFGQRYAANEASMPPSYLCFGNSEEAVTHVLEVPASLCNSLVTHACGGAADLSGDVTTQRQLSAIDCALLEQLLSPLRGALGSDVQLLGVETDQEYVGSLVSEGAGESLAFDVYLGHARTELHLSVMEDAVISQTAPQAPSAGKRPVSVLLTARMASLSVPVSRLSGLKQGDTLLLGLPADQPIELLSGGRDGVPAFEGDVGRKGSNMAVRIRKTFNT